MYDIISYHFLTYHNVLYNYFITFLCFTDVFKLLYFAFFELLFSIMYSDLLKLFLCSTLIKFGSVLC